MYYSNNKNIAVELLPLYKVQGYKKGRWTVISREKHYYQLAKSLKIKRAFVKALFDQEKNEGKYVDVGTKIRTKARLNKPKREKPAPKVKVKTHRQKCTANLTPLCLKDFITNQEETICLRCKNVDK